MQATTTVAAHRALQFPGLFGRTARPADKLQPIQRNVAPTYANQVRDSILRCSRQMSGAQSHQQRVRFLSGVEVSEISMDDWARVNETFRPVWLG
ncbi:MAG: hypothetical protein K9J82_10765 [Methylotenera sp.]|jgi:hypothetical protein|nr:hypothetical protein [Methylotenera sp.]